MPSWPTTASEIRGILGEIHSAKSRQKKLDQCHSNQHRSRRRARSRHPTSSRPNVPEAWDSRNVANRRPTGQPPIRCRMGIPGQARPGVVARQAWLQKLRQECGDSIRGPLWPEQTSLLLSALSRASRSSTRSMFASRRERRCLHRRPEAALLHPADGAGRLPHGRSLVVLLVGGGSRRLPDSSDAGSCSARWRVGRPIAP